MEIWTPIKWILFILLGLFFFSLLIRIFMKNILEVYYEQKYNYLIKATKEGLLSSLKKEKKDGN